MALFVLPGVAVGSTVTVSVDKLIYTGDPEPNQVTVTPLGVAEYLVTDSVPITPDPGCRIDDPAMPNQATCDATEVARFIFDAGEGDDIVDLSAVSTPADLNGGPGTDTLTAGSGNDTIFSRDGNLEHVFCGPGEADSANSDGVDLLHDCEQVTTGPVADIIAGPFETNKSSATFEFSSPEAPVTFECSLDSSLFVPCTPPTEVSNLADGAHVFAVRAVDQFGNAGASAARAFTVTAVPPDTLITFAPSTSDPTPTFGFSSDDPSATFQCRVDTAAFAACSSPHTTETLSSGPHIFEVRARDSQGRIDTSPASASFTVDTAASQTRITSGPSGTTNLASGTFTFISSEPNSTFECRIYGPAGPGAFSPCSSPYNFGPLDNGGYTFEVRGIDQLLNPDVPVTSSFTVTPPPALPTPDPTRITSAAGSFVVVVPPRAVRSFVLIAGRTIEVSRKRVARISLDCEGNRACAGVVSLVTAQPVRYGRKRKGVLTLASAKFSIKPPEGSKVKVRFSNKSFRLLKRLGRVRTTIRVVDRDSAGRKRISERDTFLRAARPRAHRKRSKSR